MAVLSDAQREAGWTIAKLGDAVDKIIDHRGKTPKKLGGDWSMSGHRVISALNIKNGVIDQNYHHMIDAEMYEKWMPVKFSVGDVIVTSEAPMGEVARIRTIEESQWVAGQRIFALKPDNKIVNSRYLYYSFLSSEVQHGLHSRSSGTTVIGIKQKELKEVEIPLPPLEEQERIAGILGSLDDKIEANTRLIQTLLDTADSIFQKFYSECELSESTYASLEVYGGGTPSTKNETYWGGDIHWLTPTDVTSLGSPMLFDTARKLTEDGLNACSSKLHPAGSIMMTSRATIGAFAINQYPAATNQGFIVAVPHREEERWWIYHHMKKDVPEMINSANGTTFLEISRRTFKGLPYGSLSDENLDRFHAVVNPLYELVKSSEQENLQLAETRDALIKRLIG